MEISEMEYELLQIFAIHDGQNSEMSKFVSGFKRIEDKNSDDIREEVL